MPNNTKLSNVYLDMVNKAYPYLIGFDCGYDHKRDVLYSPANSNCSVNIYGIFSKETDFSKTIDGTLGTYCVWKSKDTNKGTDIEECFPQDPIPIKMDNLIDIKEYMEMFNSPEKKVLATKMMEKSSLYWMFDDWYSEKEAYIRMESIEQTAMEAMTSMLDQIEGEGGYSGEVEDEYYEEEYDEDEDYIDEESESLELSDISYDEYNRIMSLLDNFDTTNTK